MQKINLGFLIYTYNRVDDARINMEIIKNIWQKSKLFSSIKIVHSYNGKKEWYAKKYLEDVLIRLKNPGHYQGAAELIDIGIKKFIESYKYVDYVIVVSSDTWCVKPQYVYSVLEKIKKNDLYLATCAWGLPNRNNIADVGMAIDFFIINLAWAKKYKMFPINYGSFYKKYSDLLLYQWGGNVLLEKLILARYLKASHNQNKKDVVLKYWAFSKMFILKDREPVHSHINKDGFWIRKMYWPKMGLLTHHDPEQKKILLQKLNINQGKYIKKLISSNNLNYYNKGIKIFKSYQ